MTDNKHKKFLLPLLACCVFSCLAACATAPVQAMSDARQAIRAATQAGGEQRAPEQMQAARAALTEAETALRNGQFKQARVRAEAARALAIAVQQLKSVNN